MPPVPSALRLRRRWRSLQRWLLSACDLPAPWQETPSLEIWRLPQTTSSTVAPMQTLWVGVRAGRGARWVLACVHRLDRQRLRAPPYNRKQWHPSFYYWRQAAAGHRALAVLRGVAQVLLCMHRSTTAAHSPAAGAAAATSACLARCIYLAMYHGSDHPVHPRRHAHPAIEHRDCPRPPRAAPAAAADRHAKCRRHQLR